MKKQIAGAALKYAGKGMVKGFRQKASKALDKAARAVRPNPAPSWYVAASHNAFGVEGEKVYTGTERGAKMEAAKIAKAAGHGWKPVVKEIQSNPSYDHAGASFDLFGGESRRLPKKVSEFHRPRVRVRGGTMTLADGSPFKGRVVKLNPAPRVVTHPLRVTLTAAEVKQHKQAPAAFVAALLKKAATVSQQWDHIEARGPGGRHLFDVIP